VHFAFDLISSRSPLPLISILDCLSQYINNSDFKSAAVLGTRLTMQGLYAPIIKKHGIVESALGQDIIGSIHNLIVNEIIPNKNWSDSLVKLTHKLQHVDTDCFILACTELPLVFNDHNLLKPCIDTTKILAEATFNRAVTIIPHSSF
jgi:aspartate racemase